MDSQRVHEIRSEVRRAVERLQGLERAIIEDYYFDGMSFGRIASSENTSVNRVVMAHRQALRRLRDLLTPHVAKWYGIGAVRNSECPICISDWRADAEAIIDAKTPDITWGEVMKRIERATGWRAKSPQALIMHQRRHRTYQQEKMPNDDSPSAWRSCVKDQHLDGIEVESGTVGEADGPSVGRCVPNFDVDESADYGGAR